MLKLRPRELICQICDLLVQRFDAQTVQLATCSLTLSKPDCLLDRVRTEFVAKVDDVLHGGKALLNWVKGRGHYLLHSIENLGTVHMTVSISIVGGAVSLGGMDLKVDIHGALHPLRSKGSTAVLDVGEFALLSCTMWFVLGYVHDLTIGSCFTNGANFCRTLQESDKLSGVVERQNFTWTLTECEDSIEKIGKEVEKQARIHRELLFDGCLG